MSSIPIIATCDGCSGCCRERSVPPFTGLDDPEFVALPLELQEEIRDLLLDVDREDTIESACIWLDPDTQLCTRYEHRPDACRDFERGSFYCLMFRRRWGLPTG